MGDQDMTLEQAQDHWAEGVTSALGDYADMCLQKLRRTMTKKAAVAEFRREHRQARVQVYEEPLARKEGGLVHAEADSGGGPTFLVSGHGAYQHTYNWE